jgi:hypothetical protein
MQEDSSKDKDNATAPKSRIRFMFGSFRIKSTIGFAYTKDHTDGIFLMQWQEPS